MCRAYIIDVAVVHPNGVVEAGPNVEVDEDDVEEDEVSSYDSSRDEEIASPLPKDEVSSYDSSRDEEIASPLPNTTKTIDTTTTTTKFATFAVGNYKKSNNSVSTFIGIIDTQQNSRKILNCIENRRS